MGSKDDAHLETAASFDGPAPDDTLPAVPRVDHTWLQCARARQARLTKPAGSLGRLEEAAVRLAAIQDTDRPTVHRAGIAVFAADHGVAAEGVSAYPSEVTAQMVGTILAGGAAISVLTRQHEASLLMVDVGVHAELPPHADLLDRKVRRGSRSFLEGPALTAQETRAAMAAGAEAARRLVAADCDVLIGGEMGIGNSTAAAALTAALSGCSADEATGHGTGVDAEARRRKVHIVQRALDLHTGTHDPLDLLTRLGGAEIAALVGFYLKGAASRRPLLLDGLIATAAAGVAAELRPHAADYMFAAHRSREPGHRLLLDVLHLDPLLDLDLALGEGSGAALAYPLLRSAAALLSEMRTFEEAGVRGPSR